jgi:DHA1 family bicyclomycin/chloramphenicol resistance-like MFS transporter
VTTVVVHPGDALSRRQRLGYVLLLGALTALGPFTIDLYLPAFPLIERDFDTTSGVVQLTLTATTIGFGLGQLLSGPWSDVVGRRTPLMVATAVHVLASLGVARAPHPTWLLSLRLLQGIGAAAGTVVALAMVRDLFGGRSLVRMIGNLSLVNGLAPIFAPLIGSQLLLVMPWRGMFWLLAAYGLVILACNALLLKETLPLERRRVPGHSSVRQRYGAIFRDRIFVGVALVGASIWMVIFAYLSSSPFLLQDVYGFNAQAYGLLFAVNSVGVVTGVQVSARLARRFGPQWIMLIAIWLVLLSASGVLLAEVLGLGPVGVLVALWFVIFSCGLTFPCTQVLALVNHGAEAGTAASLLGAINFLVAGAVSPVFAHFEVRDAVPMGVAMVLAAAFALVMLVVVVRPTRVPALTR